MDISEYRERRPSTLREYQAETNRQENHSSEFLRHPNCTVDAENITFTEYSKLGELPFSDATDALSKAMAYLITTIGASMQLTRMRKEALVTLIATYQQKPIVQFNKELTADFEANKIMKIYKTWPRVLAIVAHYCCSQAALTFRRIELSNNKKETKALHKAAAGTLLNGNIRATAALFHLGQEMVRLQAIV